MCIKRTLTTGDGGAHYSGLDTRRGAHSVEFTFGVDPEHKPTRYSLVALTSTRQLCCGFRTVRSPFQTLHNKVNHSTPHTLIP